ncbi:MAG TPA: UDP-N-acetylmuramoyl-tripeptide--D-alanyl-D-alanine ligase, partial [Phycisphaerales bacterium]|nr:UDP-N-acetylmuramoyl-tripeptide--D-alanyl-D-alanine ligase [Phycisphaerales bacterium]
AFTSEQLASCTHGTLRGEGNVQCSGASIDSRQCNRGNVFFALSGKHTDGHQFIEAAISAGCAAVIVNRDIEATVPIIKVENVRKALFDLAMHRREQLEFKKVVAITGSVGKTTTKDMIACMLGSTVVKSLNSFNNDLGVPLTILSAEDAEYLVAEVGANEIGEIEPLALLVRPDIGVLTSIDNAHLEGFGDCKTVLAEKVKLLESLPSNGVAVVPEDIDLSEFAISASIYTVGWSDGADVRIETGVDDDGYGTLRIGENECTLSMLGEHNAMNASLAIVASMYARPELDQSQLFNSVHGLEGSAGRLQKDDVDGISFIDDSYNANPASMRSALKLFQAISSPRKVMVLGDMLELGDFAHAEHRLLSNCIQSVAADLVIFVGPQMKITSESMPSIYEHDASIDAMLRIASLLKTGDTVLIKRSRGMHY